MSVTLTDVHIWSVTVGLVLLLLYALFVVVFMAYDLYSRVSWADDATVRDKVRVTIKYVYHRTDWSAAAKSGVYVFLLGTLLVAVLIIFGVGLLEVIN